MKRRFFAAFAAFFAIGMFASSAHADPVRRWYECKGFVKFAVKNPNGTHRPPRLVPLRRRVHGTWHETMEAIYNDLRSIASREAGRAGFHIVDWSAPPICWDQSEEEPATPSDWPVKP